MLLPADSPAAALVRTVLGIQVLDVPVPAVGIQPVVNRRHAHRLLAGERYVVLPLANLVRQACDVPMLQPIVEQREDESEAEQCYLFLFACIHGLVPPESLVPPA